MEFVPNLLSKNRDRSYHKIFHTVEIRLICICEVRIVPQKLQELLSLRLKLSILILEHPYGPTRMDNQYFSLILVKDCSSILLTRMDLLMKMNPANYLPMNLSLVHLVYIF